MKEIAPLSPSESQKISNLCRKLRVANRRSLSEIAEITHHTTWLIERVEEGVQPLTAISAFDLLLDLAVTSADWAIIQELFSDVPALRNQWELRKAWTEMGYLSSPLANTRETDLFISHNREEK